MHAACRCPACGTRSSATSRRTHASHRLRAPAREPGQTSKSIGHETLISRRVPRLTVTVAAAAGGLPAIDQTWQPRSVWMSAWSAAPPIEDQAPTPVVIGEMPAEVSRSSREDCADQERCAELPPVRVKLPDRPDPHEGEERRARDRANERDGEHRPQSAIDLTAPDKAEEAGEDPHSFRVAPGLAAAKQAAEALGARFRLRLGRRDGRLDQRAHVLLRPLPSLLRSLAIAPEGGPHLFELTLLSHPRRVRGSPPLSCAASLDSGRGTDSAKGRFAPISLGYASGKRRLIRRVAASAAADER